MTEKIQHRLRVILKTMAFFGIGCLIGALVIYVGLRLVNKGHIYPGVWVGAHELSGMTRQEALVYLENVTGEYQVELQHGELKWKVPQEYLHANTTETVNRAYSLGRRIEIGELVAMIRRKMPVVEAIVVVDRSEVNVWFDDISSSVEVVPVVTGIKTEKGKVVITNGSDGTLLAREELFETIETRAKMLSQEPATIPLRPSYKKLSEEELARLQQIAEGLVDKTLVVVVDDIKIELGVERLLSFLATEPGKVGDWEGGVVENYVTMLEDTYNRQSQNAKFEVVDGKVKEFAPSKDGLVIIGGETKRLILDALPTLSHDKSLQVVAVLELTPPEVSTADVNKLGIEKRIGKGESYYAHSIPGRVHNVGLTSSRVSGALIPPGEEFSFNEVVGEISGATGYAPAYVIKNGRTELGDGGGVCQVSTTVFRAALSAGLPITERWAHAYRVGYYEQQSEPGIDATIYSPSKDLRFLNDTPGHILVQAINDPKTLHLSIEIYGTDDGRVSEISKVKVWGNTPPPPDLYQDDPSLPLGKIRQVDWSAWGAKTTFDYKVTRNGEMIYEKSFPSTYRAWQNVYLRGTKTD